MSFSQDVKEELVRHIQGARHCQMAEMAAYTINLCKQEEGKLCYYSENECAIRKANVLLKKIFGIKTEIEIKENQRGNVYYIFLEAEDSGRVLEALKMTEGIPTKISELLIKNSCCKRSYLQGMFVCAGSMISPDKSYHLEIVSTKEEKLKQVVAIIKTFDIEAKITTRKKSFVLYLKEGAAIVDLLNIMGAHVSLMNMENEIILKDMRNDLNRRVNCETANIIKSINAASKQIEDIEYIKACHAFETLPDSLKDMANVRVKYSDVPLKDLGSYLNPPVGKSGVNHRLRRLSEIANELRDKERNDE